jgi:O-antigen/teichoic acid export membrane protein
MSVWENLRAQLPQRGKLSGRAARASAWSMGELGLSYVLRLGSNLVMTRLLMPEAFGLMAMVVTLHMALTLLSDIGIEQSIIRTTRGDEPRFLRVAWTIQILRCGVVALGVLIAAAALWILAPSLAPAGTVYADPSLPALIVVSALVVILSGLESTNKYLASRRMQLKMVAILNISGQLVALVAMVTISLLHPSVWSLLWGMIAGAAFHTVMSHILFAGPRMGLAWDREIADELWHFGKWIIGSSVMSFVGGNADRIFLGAVLDKEHFGFYVIALIWVQAGITVIHRIAGKIGLPLFSDVSRERPDELLRVFHRFSRLNAALASAGFLGLFFGGAALILLLYPSSYAQSASFMPFLALAMLREWFTPVGVLLMSQGNSKASAMAAFAEAVSICLCLYAGIKLMGIEGALFAVALSSLAGAAVHLVIAHRTLGLSLRGPAIIMTLILVVAGAVGFFFDPIP